MKIKCRDCKNETKGKCAITKATVKLTKSRKCNYYEFDETNELVRLENRARAMDNQDRAYQSRQATLAELQTEVAAHPTTGDLSRFTTTAT